MAVLNPLKVIIYGIPSDISSVAALDYPFDATRGSHQVPLENIIYIDKSDFRMVDHEVCANPSNILKPYCDIRRYTSGLLWFGTREACWLKICYQVSILQSCFSYSK